MKDDGAAEAETHGHTLAPLTEDQLKVLQAGIIQMTAEVDFYKKIPSLLNHEYSSKSLTVSAETTMEAHAQNLIDSIFIMLNDERYYA